MVPDYPDHGTRATADDDTGETATTLNYYDYPVYSTIYQDVPAFEVKKEKVYCFFLVAHKGILPNPCRDIRNDEVPYGFG